VRRFRGSRDQRLKLGKRLLQSCIVETGELRGSATGRREWAVGDSSDKARPVESISTALTTRNLLADGRIVLAPNLGANGPNGASPLKTLGDHVLETAGWARRIDPSERGSGAGFGIYLRARTLTVRLR